MEELATIQSKIYEIRGQRVMLDRDLAELYGVTTGNLNKAVKRNIERFPERFMFQLTEQKFLIFQNGTSSWGGTRKRPYAFTEQGVSMLSAVLRSPTAIQVSIRIMDAFVAMRNYIMTTSTMTAELSEIRAKLTEKGQTVELTATVAPENATNKNVIFETSDEKVATVDGNGKVSAVANGKATITVTTEDGEKTAACEVTVEIPNVPVPAPEELVNEVKTKPSSMVGATAI